MSNKRNAVIVAAARTAIGRAIKGSLRNTRPEVMGKAVIQAVLERAKPMTPDMVDDLILGCAMPEGEQGINMARQIGLFAGLPYTVPAMTVNRFCSSGIETIALAAQRIIFGDSDVIIAGGVESMSMVPMGGNKPSIHAELVETYPEAYSPMGLTAEFVARRFNISRTMQDEFAVKSQEKALKAMADGKFKGEIVPLKTFVWEDDGTKNEIVFDQEEIPRAGTTMETLAKLKPAFDPTGSVTAGNSSPLSDGAGVVLLMTEEKAKELGLKPLVAFRHYQVAGVPPEIMGIGPAEAVPKLMKKAGIKTSDVDVYEVNEAFASQSVYCVNKLELDASKVNINGGAIALGHPLGATGAKLTTQGINELLRRNGKYLVVTMCIGGGMGAAGLFERY